MSMRTCGNVARPSGAILQLLGAQVAIGAAAIFARFALAGAGPLVVSALRLAIATAIVAAFALPLERISRRREVAFAAAGLALAAHFALWIGSLSYTTVAASTLLVTTTPLWTTLYDAARTRRVPSRPFLVALGLALVGTIVIVGSRTPATVPIPGRTLVGDAMALAASFAIGVYLVVVRDAGAKHERPLATRGIVTRTYAWATLALVVGSLLGREAPPPPANGRAWGGILAMALVSQTIGHTALNAALRSFSPSVVALATLLEPVVAALLAIALFREEPSFATTIGGVVVLVGVGIALADARTANAPASIPAIDGA